jgi:hypothetical protein
LPAGVLAEASDKQKPPPTLNHGKMVAWCCSVRPGWCGVAGVVWLFPTDLFVVDVNKKSEQHHAANCLAFQPATTASCLLLRIGTIVLVDTRK